MDNSTIVIRPALPGDLPEMQKLFVETIEAICRKDYSSEQISAWTATIKNTNRWNDRLKKQYFLLAEVDSTIIGYASLEGNNHLDFLYVHKNFQRQGIADRLYTEIEREAIKRGAIRLTSDVSITAKPFFEKKGFMTLLNQTNVLDGIEMINYKMEKDLLT